MKVFPTKIITVNLRDDRASTLAALRRNTELKNKLISIYTNKAFIGQVDDSGFKIISSEVGRGAFCIFTGVLQDSKGEVEISVHPAFRILLSILLLMPVIGFLISVATKKIDHSYMLLIPMILAVLFIRFVFMELCFRFISRTGLNKLKNILMWS